MSETYFDRLPGELIYELFSYFSSHEIFQSFYSISHYIDGIIEKYDNYYLDLSMSTIRKKEFDLICLMIHPEQIRGLRFGPNTFLFIQNYLIDRKNKKKLSRLQSFWLDSDVLYNEQLSQWIHSHINYESLHSFRFDSMDERLFPRNSVNSFDNLSHLVGCSSELFGRLSNQIPRNLTFLHMFFNSIDHLIFLLNSKACQLKSLGIGIKCDINQFSSLFNNYQWTNLIQFNLNLQEMPHIQWTNIEEILSPMNQLKYLTLILSKQNSTNSRLFDGKHWQDFLSLTLPSLKKFDFKFPVDTASQINIPYYLRYQFQTSWWVDVKHWYVEYLIDEKAFVTVPYFTKTILENSDLVLSNLITYRNIFYSNIVELKLNLYQFVGFNGIYFPHVKRLSFNGTLTTNQLAQIRDSIDVKKIEYFQIISTNDQFDEDVKLLLDMTNLSSLDIQCRYSICLFRLISSPLVSIRCLVLRDCEETTINHVYSDLCHLFPNLTHLTSEYQSRDILSDLLNHLFNIEHLIFLLKDHHHVPNHRWIEEHTRLKFDSFQSDIFNFNHQKRVFFIWINQDKNIDQILSRNEHWKCLIQ